MTNRIEVFQPECKRLAVAGGTVTVRVDGRLCSDLEPLEIVRSCRPEFGSARLLYNSATRGQVDPTDPEDIENLFPMGSRISLHQSYNAASTEFVARDLPLFVGRIETIERRIDAGDERVEIVARDHSATLRRVTVYGQHLPSNGATVFLPGLATIFNPAGRGNAATERITTDGRTRTLFAATGQKAWTCAEAIHYLLVEYAPPGQLAWPAIEQLRALTGDCLVRDLDVTGLSLLEALHRCCEAAGVRFRFVPRLVENEPGQAIVFYRTGRTRTVEINGQPRGEALSPSRTNVAGLRASRSLYPVTHRYIAQGDFKVYEATFELVAAWDPALEGTDYSVFSPSTNPEFASVRDVYRRWCLNEAGDYTAAPFQRGPAYDFSAVFEGDSYTPHRRRFWPALSSAGSNASAYHLEVSLDGGLNWSVYAGAFDNLLDECGVWLSGDQLDVHTWVAALKGTLRFRITASVVSDERLTCILADGPVGSTAPVVDHLLTLPHRFRYRKVSPQSVLANSTDGPANEVDDSAALYEFVRQRCLASPATIETMDVRTLTLDLHLQPGDRVASNPDSRDLFATRRDSRSRLCIERVVMDFRQQCTKLRLTRYRQHEL